MHQLGTEGTKLIQAFEDLRLHAYQDGGGVWTIGWGHTGPEVQSGCVITERIADKLFELDAKTAVDAVNRLVTAEIDQNQFDALVSLVFNIGVTAFGASTILRMINAGNAEEAGKTQFKRWVKDDRQVVRGLINRRAAEEHLYFGRLDGWRQVVKITQGKDIA